MVLCICGLRLDLVSELMGVCKDDSNAPLFVSMG